MHGFQCRVDVIKSSSSHPVWAAWWKGRVIGGQLNVTPPLLWVQSYVLCSLSIYFERSRKVTVLQWWTHDPILFSITPLIQYFFTDGDSLATALTNQSTSLRMMYESFMLLCLQRFLCIYIIINNNVSTKTQEKG